MLTWHVISIVLAKYVSLVRQREATAIAREETLAATAAAAANNIEILAQDIAPTKRPLEFFINEQTVKKTLSKIFSFLKERGHLYNDKIAFPDINLPAKKSTVVNILVNAFLKVAKPDASGNQDASAIQIFKEICYEKKIEFKRNVNQN